MEATILAEKELEVPSISNVENTVDEYEVIRTTDADEARILAVNKARGVWGMWGLFY